MSGKKTKGDRPWNWADAVRAVGFACWLAAIAGIALVPDGPRLFWTVLVASLPMFWVVAGYYPWRRICPLAAWSQIPRWLGRPGQRKAPEWLVKYAILVQLALMVVGLTTRLLGANGTPQVLAAMLIVLSGASLLSGVIFRGKTWCNYICPVGLIERIYTEPIQLASTENSQCQPCTACKKNCPDIDLEQAYWKEAEDPYRRVAYFAWPGIVLAFYLWFWLKTGTWEYYYSGAWASESVTVADLLGPGFFFAPAIPWLVAAPFTLLVFGAASWALFSFVDSFLDDEWRHAELVAAGFIAITFFYIFAGQPTIRLGPDWLGEVLQFGILFATAYLFFKRLTRTERDHVRERFAKKILKRWKWGDRPDDEDLAEVYVVHAERKREQEARLDAYAETLRELAQDGVLSRGKLSVLDTIRGQLKISDAEHEKVLKKLEASDRALFDADAVQSAEERLQLEQYRQELESLVHAAADDGRPLDEVHIYRLRASHGVTDDQHALLLRELQDPDGAVASRLRSEVERVRSVADILSAIRHADTNGAYVELAVWFANDAAHHHTEHLLAFVPALVGDLGLAEVQRWLADGGEVPRVVHGTALEAVLPALAEAREALESGAASNRGLPEDVDESPWLGAICAVLKGDTSRQSTLDRMTALRKLDLLREVSPADLERLTRVVEERTFAPGEALCEYNAMGDEVFILLSGHARVWLPDEPDRTLRDCGPGTCVGELAVLDAAPRSAMVTAVDRVKVLSLPGEDFRGVMDRQPGMVRGVMRELVRRLRSAR